MLRPAMSQIIGDDKSQYAFVVAVAKNARKIAEEAEREGISLDKKPVTLSTEQFAARKVLIDDFIESDGQGEDTEVKAAEVSEEPTEK